jgi:hypothetical protein
MFDVGNAKFNPESLISFFQKNKRLKLSKREFNFISDSNMFDPQTNNFLIINGFAGKSSKGMNQIKNFNSTNYNKWNYKNPSSNSNLNSQKFNGFYSTGKNFYKGKITQSSYGRKIKLKGSSQKKNLKMNSKNSLIENKIPERVRSVRGGNSLEQKNALNNRLFERFYNQCETNVKKVLYDIGVVGSIKEKIISPLSRSNNNNIKSFNTKNSIKSKNDKNNLPFLNQNQPDGSKMNYQKPKKVYGYSNLIPPSETNIININNFINVYSDENNINYNTNNNNNNNNNLMNNYNNNYFNNIYGTLTNTTLNNNLATNSTNSNI